MRPPNNWRNPYIVTYYVGDFDILTAEYRPHGNVKDTPQKSDNLLREELLGNPPPIQKPGRFANKPGLYSEPKLQTTARKSTAKPRSTNFNRKP